MPRLFFVYEFSVASTLRVGPEQRAKKGGSQTDSGSTINSNYLSS